MWSGFPQSHAPTYPERSGRKCSGMPRNSAAASRKAETTFEKIHAGSILGKVIMFDRMIFKGHMRAMYADDAFRVFLWRQGIPLRSFGEYVQKATAKLKQHAEKLAQDAGRPFIYLQSAHTRTTGKTKEELAREIAERDGVTEGLVCVLSTIEPCSSFDLQRNEHGRLKVVPRRRQCLHFYYYLIDPDFGFMHIKLQSWFPMQIQVYVNGREWLCRQLDRKGIGYKRYGNTLLHIDDLRVAQDLCARFFKRRWPRLLNRFARMVNPWFDVFRRYDFPSYYWVTDQVEVATDVMFDSCTSLRRLMPELLEHATLHMSAHDVLRFAGGKRLCSEISTDHKERPEGRRVKHRIKRNSIKMYDKHSVLRIETTINNPREFRVLRVETTSRGRRFRRWKPMRKGVADLWRLAQVGRTANSRYLEAFAYVKPRGKAVRELDRLCQSRRVKSRRYARFNPVARHDAALFSAVLRGENTINGFRNRDLARHLYPRPSRSPEERKRRCARTSRLIAKLRGHGLVAKVPRTRLYRVTQKGYRTMSAAISFREQHWYVLAAPVLTPAGKPWSPSPHFSEEVGNVHEQGFRSNQEGPIGDAEG